MQLLRSRDDLIQIGYDGVTFKFWDAHNLGHKSGVEEERFPTRYRVRTDEWMLGDDRKPPNCPA